MTKRAVRRDDDAPRSPPAKLLRLLAEACGRRRLVRGATTSDEVDEQDRPSTIDGRSTCQKPLPGRVVVTMLHDICGFKEDTIRLLEQSAELERVWIYIFGRSPEADWPFPLHRGDIMKQFLLAQLERMGRRHKKVLQHMDKSGKVDWDRATPYKLTYTSNKEGFRIVDSIKHMSGAKVEVAWCNICAGLTVEEPWNDLKAYFSCHGKWELARYFDPQASFRKLCSASFFEEEALRLLRVMPPAPGGQSQAEGPKRDANPKPRPSFPKRK